MTTRAPRFCIAICWIASVLTHMATASERLPSSDTPSVAENSVAAVVRQPRSFGYFVGDVVTQEVSLELAKGTFEPAELPRAERVGVWFERRRARVVSIDGERWLRMEYQIINAPQETRTIELPGLQIEDASGARALSVAASPISIAPLTAALPSPQDALHVLRPDRRAPQIATTPIERRLIVYGAGCALVLAAWSLWFAWRNWRSRLHQPFAHAWQEIRTLDERAPEAWQALHRAFDRTAGRVTQGASLSALFQRAPHLTSQRERIEQFYAQSTDFFFGGGLPADALSVRELCRELRRLEKRHER